MFGREKNPAPLDRIEVTVGPTANITGDLECDVIVKIECVYQGSIKTVSNVIIGEDARVDAHIEAENVSVSGQVKGTIVAKSRLEILSTGRVWADATVTSFLLDDGGKLHGGLKMFVTGPEPDTFSVPPQVSAVAAASETEVAEEPTVDEPVEDEVPAEED